MEKMALFGEGRNEKENLFKQTGRGIIAVGTVVGAGILVGMGLGAFKGASESI